MLPGSVSSPTGSENEAAAPALQAQGVSGGSIHIELATQWLMESMPGSSQDPDWIPGGS